MEEETIIYGENYLSILVDALNSNNKILNDLGESQVYVLIRWGNKTMGEVYDMLHKHGYAGTPKDLLDIYNKVRSKVSASATN